MSWAVEGVGSLVGTLILIYYSYKLYTYTRDPVYIGILYTRSVHRLTAG